MIHAVVIRKGGDTSKCGKAGMGTTYGPKVTCPDCLALMRPKSDPSAATKNAERFRSFIVTITKNTRDDEEMFFTTTWTGEDHVIEEVEWRSDESFEEIVIHAFGLFDTSRGVFPVLRRSDSNSDVWFVTNSLNAPILEL